MLPWIWETAWLSALCHQIQKPREPPPVMVLCPQQTTWKTHQENCLSFFHFNSHHLIASEMCQPFHSPIEKMASPGDNRVCECASGGVQGHYPGQEAYPSKHMFHTFSCGARAGYRASLSLRDWIRVERWSLVEYSMPENHRTCSLGDYSGVVCYRLTWQTRQNFLNFNMPAGNPGSFQNEDSDLEVGTKILLF